MFDNKLWNEDGPAAIYYNKNGQIIKIIYAIRSLKHREDGPAVIWSSQKMSDWYYNGFWFKRDESIPLETQIAIVILENS